MPTTFEILKTLAPIVIGLVGALIGAVIWFIRLEGRVNYGDKMQDQQNKRMDDLENLLKRQGEVIQIITSMQADLRWVKKLLEKALKINLDDLNKN